MVRRQQLADRALRPAMGSPGRPMPARHVEREFWRLIARGKRTEDAALEVGVSTPVASRWFRHAGGMPPLSLAEPTGRYLSFHEREDLALLKAKGLGVRAIARELKRDPGTVSRELRRNAATRGGRIEYRATVAQWKAQTAARRPKPAKLASNPRLQEYVQTRLSGQLQRPDGTVAAGPSTIWKGLNKPHRADRRWATAWSPEQISRRLVVDFPDDADMRISHEAIYQALYIEGRGALKRELVACLRTGRALRKPRERSRNKPQGHVTAEVVLTERPAEAEDRAAGRGRGPRGPRALGGRLDYRADPVRHRHCGRAHQPLHAARSPAASGGLRHCPTGQERTCPRRLRRRRDEGRPHDDDGHDARRAAALADLGPRQGALRARSVQGRHRHRRLLRRPALALAARYEREHQRPAAPVLPQGHRPLSLEPRGPPRRPGRGQQQAPQGPRLENPGRGPRRASTVAPPSRCCNDRLSPSNTPRPSSTRSPPATAFGAVWVEPGCAGTTLPPSHSLPL